MPRTIDRVPRVLAVGMLPPPLGGQALMFEAAVRHFDHRARIDVIDLQVQQNIGEAGLFSLGKLLSLAKIVGRCLKLGLSRGRFDILYYCPSGPSTFGVLKDVLLLALLRPFCRNTVYHFHATGGINFLLDRGAVVRGLAKWFIWKPDLSIRCADVEPNDAVLCQSKRLATVWNGIQDPLELFTEEWRWTPPERLTLSFIGAMTEEKGIFDLVRAAGILKRTGVDFQINFIGEGTREEIAKFDELVTSEGCMENIVRLGVLSGRAKFEALGRSTFFTFPTFFRAETQPLVVIEALAMGVPAIVSDWRGLRSLVTDGEEGMIVPPRNPDALAHAIQFLVADGDLAAMSARARRKFEDCFTLSKFEANLSREVEHLLER